MSVLVRPTEARDTPAIDTLCNSLYKQEPGASKLLETSLLCLTAVSDDNETVLGFLCLHDGPAIRFGSPHSAEQLEWLSTAPQAQINTCSSAYVWVCAVAPQVEMQCSLALLRGAMAALPLVRKLQLAVGSGSHVPERGLVSLLTPMAASRGAPVTLYEVVREELLPPLAMRAARVEDHDDMLPVLQRAEARFPALAKLPESSRPEEAFALTRVVSGQDDANVVLVAHELHAPAGSDASGRLVGFMVVTSDVDVTPLADAFDLHSYDNFLPEEVYEAQAAEARETLRTKKRNTLEAKLGDRVLRMRKTPDAMDASTQASDAPEGKQVLAEGEQARASESHGADTDGEQQACAPEDQIDITAACEPSEEEVRAEMLAMFDMSEAVPTVFAVTMACIDRECDAQTLDFLREAFESFPDKMYCLLTLPHDSPEPPLVAPFTRLTPLPGASFPEVLYLFHRHAMMDSFEVRLAAPKDADGVSMLISGMPNSSDIKELFAAALDRGTAVVAVAAQEVVGLVTISDKVDVSLLESNFSLSSLLHLPHHAPEAHGEIDMVCINPIFSHHARTVLSGAQRLLRKTVLYYALPPAQPPPDVLDIMMQVPPRSKHVQNADEAEFALYMFSRRHAFVARQAVNAQLVVVGASEAGLAAIECLLMDRKLCFNYITVLAPGGISVTGMASQYSAGVIAKLGLDARVTLVDAEMLGLDTQARMIELSDGSHLMYDLLIVTCGLQEQTCNDMAETEPEVAGSVLNALELASGFTVGDAAAMQQIMVYGHTLDSYHALATLESKGAMSQCLFYAPPGPVQPHAAVLRRCADALALPLPEPLPMTLCSMLHEEGNKQKSAIVQAPDGVTKESVQVDLVVGCQQPQASKTVFLCLNNAGVVYDGRVVVDSCFRTSEPQIYAAGTIAKLSRRHARNVHFEHYNSREVGFALGKSVITAFQGQQQADQMPALGQQHARAVGCAVPGGYTFLFSGCPTAMASPSLAAPAGGKALHTVSDRGVMHVLLDASGSIHSVAYLGKGALQVSKLACLVGLNRTYLNGLVEQFDAGQVDCLISHLTVGVSTELIYHEQFAQLRQQQLLSSLELLGSGATTADVLSAAQNALLEFCRGRMEELPGFSTPVLA